MRPILYQYENPHSRVRADGRRGFYHPTRQGGKPRLIVLHTAETRRRPGGARAVATWQARWAERPSSYHALADAGEVVIGLPDEAVAFHVVSYNTMSLGLSFATFASAWGQDPEWDDAALRLGAQKAAEWCRLYSIPVEMRTKAQIDRGGVGASGFSTHARLDPARRSDPGAGFPLSTFFRYVRAELAPAAPKPSGPRTHTVQRGETLWGISRRYGTTVAAMASANNLSDPSQIRPGQVLTIPGGAAVTAPAPSPAPTPAPRPPAATPAPPWRGKVLRARQDLRYYPRPRWTGPSGVLRARETTGPITDYRRVGNGAQYQTTVGGKTVWITAASRFVELVTPSARNPYAGKRLVARQDVVFYDRPGWRPANPSAGVVRTGHGFPTILELRSVGRGRQFRVANSRGREVWITASPRFVRVV